MPFLNYLKYYTLLHSHPSELTSISLSDWNLLLVITFTGAKIQGCLWHLSRSFVKKANKLRLLRFKRAYPDLLHIIRKACCIALLPRRFFADGLQILKDEAMDTHYVIAYLLIPFFEYVERRWLNNAYRRRWMSLFNVEHRTNNSCETQNRMLRAAVGAYRPNIYTFLAALSRMEHNAFLDIDLMRRGGSARRTRRHRSVFSDAQLKALSDDLRRDVFRDRYTSVKNFLDRAADLIVGTFDQHVEGRV